MTKMIWNNSSWFPKFEDVKNEGQDSESSSFLESQTRAVQHKIAWVNHATPWVVSTFFFAILSLYLALQRSDSVQSSGAAWDTDFADTRSHIHIEEVLFNGSPAFKESTMFVPHPDPIKYVGDPTPEIDQAWDELTAGRYILISEQEATEAFSEHFGDVEQFYSPQAGGYVAGLDMFHTLHCVNRMRKLFYPDYYPESHHRNHILHREHCLEQIRQYIMCAGDMTPIPTRYVPSLGHNYVDSDVKHTCRNFGELRSWSMERFNGSTAVKPKCAGTSRQEKGVTLCDVE